VISNYEAMIMGDTDGVWCNRRSSVEDMINSADGSAIDSKEGGFCWKIKSVIGVEQVEGSRPVLEV
jgi:hypothetical protein